MEIDFEHTRILFNYKFNIFIDGKLSYTTSRNIFSWFARIKLFLNEQENPVIIIKQKNWIKTRYEIVELDNNAKQFQNTNIWKLNYKCIVGSDSYEIFGQKGFKYSVFKNNIQIAWWDRVSVINLEIPQYKIIADSDSNPELLISFCLIIDNLSKPSNGIDFGNILQGSRKFDAEWKPKC